MAMHRASKPAEIKLALTMMEEDGGVAGRYL